MVLSLSLISSKQFDNHKSGRESDENIFGSESPILLSPIEHIYNDFSGCDSSDYTSINSSQVLSLDQLFKKNGVELAILVYHVKTKRYYVYDKNKISVYKNDLDAYYVLVDEDRKPIYLSKTTYLATLFPYEGAIEGDARAEEQLGFKYMFSRGVRCSVLPINQKRGFEWMMKSAQHGYDLGQFNVARAYFKGWGVTRDTKKGFEWLKKSAENGYIAAAGTIAICYECGLDVEQNTELALQWYLKASENHDIESCYQLGGCYAQGKWVPQNYEKAFEYYTAIANLKYDQSEAIYYARASLGVMYEEGLGVEKNEAKAIEWYEKALEKNMFNILCGVAANNLAIYLLQGNGIGQVKKRAFELLEMAANKDSDSAMLNLGLVHEYGLVNEKNEMSAFFWYKKSAERENDNGLLYLGRCFFYGIGVERNYNKARELFMQAALRGNASAHYFLGLICEFGLVGSVNIEEARHYYLKASDSGVEKARVALGQCGDQEQKNKIDLKYQILSNSQVKFFRSQQWRIDYDIEKIEKERSKIEKEKMNEDTD